MGPTAINILERENNFEREREREKGGGGMWVMGNWSGPEQCGSGRVLRATRFLGYAQIYYCPCFLDLFTRLPLTSLAGFDDDDEDDRNSSN